MMHDPLYDLPARLDDDDDVAESEVSEARDDVSEKRANKPMTWDEALHGEDAQVEVAENCHATFFVSIHNTYYPLEFLVFCFTLLLVVFSFLGLVSFWDEVKL